MSPQISPILTTTPAIKEELKKVEQEQAEELLFPNQSTQEISTTEDFQEENQEITFKEGLELFGQGAWNKVKEMGSAIINHPGKTLLAVGATTAAIAALPLIGISSATGAAALAIGFGVASIFNTGKDIKETIEDYNEGKFDEAREDIQELGGDGVDLAMSLPFMPKAIKQVGRTVKYGTSTIGLNTSLISDLKNVSNLDDVAVAFGKANARINYEMIGSEAGLAVKPELIFEKMNNKNIAAQFEPTTGKVIYNENALSMKNPIKYALSQDDILRHELKHFEQFTEIARANGPEAVAKTMTEYYTKILGEKSVAAPTKLAQLKQSEKDMWHEHNTTLGKSIKELNKQLANSNDDIQNLMQNVDEFGRGESLTQFESKTNLTELDDMITKMKNLETKLGTTQKEITGLENSIIDKNNILKHRDFDVDTVRNMTSGDKSVFNQGFWDDVVASKGSTSSNPEAITKANEYAAALLDKVEPSQTLIDEIMKKHNVTSLDKWFETPSYQKAQQEIYMSNLLEKEAFTAGGEFAASNLQLKEAIIPVGGFALNEAEKNFSEDDKNLKEIIFSKATIASTFFGPLGELFNKIFK